MAESHSWSEGGTKASLSEVRRHQSEYFDAVLDKVFHTRVDRDNEKQVGGFSHLEDHLQRVVDACGVQNVEENVVGRLMQGESVQLDTNGNSGTLLMDANRLGAISHSNFSTVRADACVFAGKWMFEVMLNTDGVMQLGWATISCHFSQELGVGDTKDSYAYDGHRKRRWNMQAEKYGESWYYGDVIGCCFDCDTGTLSFYRNGSNMGEAYSSIRRGKGIAYFPAFSLSLGESIQLNFGAVPFRHPVEGFRALQDPPLMSMATAGALLGYLDGLVNEYIEIDQKRNHVCQTHVASNSPLVTSSAAADVDEAPIDTSRSALLQLAAGHLFRHLAPLLAIEYIVDNQFVPLLLRYSEQENAEQRISVLLDFVKTFTQKAERRKGLTQLLTSFLHRYTFAQSDQGYDEQVMSKLFSGSSCFVQFMYVRRPSDAALKASIPVVSWDPEDESEKAIEYDRAYKEMRRTIQELEDKQIELLKLLLQNDDSAVKKPSSRSVFLHKFRRFLIENGKDTENIMNVCPPAVSLCFFHRLVRTFWFYWDSELVPNGTLEEAFVSADYFFNDEIAYFDIQRLGGLTSHLKKKYSEMVTTAMGTNCSGQECAAAIVTDGIERPATQKNLPASTRSNSSMLCELLDGLIMLYNTVAHKQLMRTSIIQEDINDFREALNEVQNKIKECPSGWSDVRKALEESEKVFNERLEEQDKQEDVFHIHQCCLLTLIAAAERDAEFEFVPDFYPMALIKSYNLLKLPTADKEKPIDYADWLVKFSSFLACYYADDRIISGDVRDLFVQTLCSMVCSPTCLKALEGMQLEDQTALVTSLLTPYESRSWAQSNLVLVRIWKGCGFAFRYKHLPHIFPSKNKGFDLMGVQAPLPSSILQSRCAAVLRSKPKRATKLFDTLLNQLNWAYSEFVGLLQELQQLNSRPQVAVIESRQLRVCATCFEVAVGLLRVMEMIVHHVPELLLQADDATCCLLLSRTMQMLSQVLNRMNTGGGGVFDFVVGASLPGMETVERFPILTAVTGVLLALFRADSKRLAEAIIHEASFDISSLELLLGAESDGEASAAGTNDKKKFSLRNYEDDVTAEEIQELERFISDLKMAFQTTEVPSTPEISDEDVCEICYARAKSVIFVPCGHKSCRSCVSHHLMSNDECFFCKATIDSLQDIDVHVSDTSDGGNMV